MRRLAGIYRQMIDRRPSNLINWAVFLLLWPCSQFFRLIVWLRTLLYARGVRTVYRAAIPVVSIGNLAVGGTGKTPVTDLLAKRLLAMGVRVAVVSRGYGGRYDATVGVVATGNGQLLMSAEVAGDEPCLLARRNPALMVFVARVRTKGVRAAEEAGAQLVLLDDGFQHLAVHRDADIVLLDCRAPFGNGLLLPAGPLREPPTALRRADLLILTHAEGPEMPAVPFPGKVLRCRHRLGNSLQTLDGEAVPWSALDGEAVLAFAGIAHPDDFFSALRARGVSLAGIISLDDHQRYTDDRLNRLLHSCNNYSLLITTEKDAVKLRAANLPCRCLVAPLDLEFDEPGELDIFLGQIVAKSVAKG